MTYGVIAFAPFGAEFTSYGITAGLFGAIVSSLLLLPFGAKTPMGAGPRAASMVIFAGLCTQLLANDTFFSGAENRNLAILAIGFLTMALAGLIQALAGLGRVGTIVKFIPYPVVAGFINASVILIILSQIWPLLGLERQVHVADLVTHYPDILPLALVPGVGAMLTMVLVKRFKAPVPGPLTGLLAGAFLHHGLLAAWPDAAFGSTLRAMDGWLPMMPLVTTDGLGALLASTGQWGIWLLVVPAALSMAVISSFDTMFSITALDEITEKSTDANRELRAHGFANLVAAMLGGLNSAGGLNRTKPALDAGVTDATVHPATGLLMLLAVIFLAGWISYLPLSVIGGVMIYLCFGLFDRWIVTACVDVAKGRTTSRLGTSLDIAIVLLVIALALTFNLMVAVIAGTLLSVILFAAKISRSPIKSIARGPLVHSLKIWDPRRQAILNEHADKVALIKLQGAIFFGTSDGLERQLEMLLDDGICFMVLDFKSVTDIDISGTRALLRFHKKIKSVNGLLVFSYIKRDRRAGAKRTPGIDRRRKSDNRQIWKAMAGARLIDIVGEDNFVFDSDSGLARCEEQLINLFEADFSATHSDRHRHKSLLHHLSLADFRALRSRLSRKEYAAGETIFEQGDKGDCAYFLARGEVDIRLQMEAGGETKLLQSLMPGAVFGEMALLDDEVRSADVLATEKSTCYLLSLDEFDQLRKQEPAIIFKMINWVCMMFSDRLRNANKMILELEG